MRALAISLALVGAAPAAAEPLQAVVPTRVVHPGQTLTLADLRVVDVRNPKPVARPVARELGQALGLVSKRTLLPRRYIALSSLRAAHAVEAGKVVELRYRRGAVLITLPGTALGSAAPGKPVAVRVKGGRSVLGTVAGSGVVEVSP